MEREYNAGQQRFENVKKKKKQQKFEVFFENGC
jgi:hypothetical protein